MPEEQTGIKPPGLFDIIGEVQNGKRNLVALTECKYPAFMVNRALSQNIDTILFAQEMNRQHHLPGEWQMEFLIHAVPKKKRWGKWAKKHEPDPSLLDAIQQEYEVNRRRAARIQDRLTEHQKQQLVEHQTRAKGGVVKK